MRGFSPAGEHAAVRNEREEIMLYRSRIVAVLFAVLSVLATSVACAKPPTLPSDEFQATACEVGDGDSIHLCFDGRKAKARLIGIDAPEYHEGQPDASQPYGKEARDALARLVLNKRVRVYVVQLDQYRRPLVVVFVGNTHVNQTLVERGDAYAYTGKGAPKDTGVYRELEHKAREGKCGFWAMPKNKRPKYPGTWKRKRRR